MCEQVGFWFFCLLLRFFSFCCFFLSNFNVMVLFYFICYCAKNKWSKTNLLRLKSKKVKRKNSLNPTPYLMNGKSPRMVRTPEQIRRYIRKKKKQKNTVLKHLLHSKFLRQSLCSHYLLWKSTVKYFEMMLYPQNVWFESTGLLHTSCCSRNKEKKRKERWMYCSERILQIVASLKPEYLCN